MNIGDKREINSKNSLVTSLLFHEISSFTILLYIYTK